MEQNKSGTNKLAERILADARRHADKTIMEANATAMQLSADNVDRCSALRRELKRKREIAVQGVLDGSKTRAAIDGRKAALKKKREMIDTVFDRAYAALCALDAVKRGEICRALLRSVAERGETVYPAAADRQKISEILSDMEELNLTLADSDAAYDGGFLLVGPGYEKDCSFRAVLSQLRDTEETAIANLIFH